MDIFEQLDFARPDATSVSRSMRTLSDGSALALDLCMKLILLVRGVRLPLKAFANKANRLHNSDQLIFRGRHEFSVVVFAVAGWSLPAQPSRCDGALDADARRRIELRAPQAECRIL
jgi:hypothetical protein